ncbi:putative siderochrome-iron transporter [Aspergillus novofumigatus IBT 16806]|uniref:Siderochrome-iron transporter MirC n=1 Tax=Aspergillus novofumigatus (strain IBT 16806) TaxID=1392255 RepID=A0A2I1BVE0_ASPN1|nr:siderochrome-iron transporter MirC [Aspergillus novofumigatus IBT 16806]PKX89342.1 siderochrome-iron transporter MirC [Aspergillus novofumigatus IBT 16806]
MGLDTSTIRKTDLIEDRLSNPEDEKDNAHNDERLKGASVTRIGVIDSVSGPRSKYILYAGELDNSTVSTYRNYAASEFGQLSMLATLNTVTTETYIITVTCYVLSYILCASARSLDTYAGGCVLYALGQSGTSILNAIVISDISSMQWRGVVNGIGWRWGIGMFAILMPSCASIIIISLLVFQHRAKKAGSVVCHRPSLHGFCSGIDLGGIAILTCGFSSLLIPITLAATTTSRWKTPWIDALIVVGAGFLACLYPYEKYIAKHPVIPVRYFHALSVLVPVALACIDNIGFGTTHTYLYAWSMVSHNFTPRNAQFLSWTSGVMQALAGMCIGLLMYRLRRYKWIAVAGSIVRLIGYGLMVRLRTDASSLAELFIVQLIQGLGSGIIETVAIVATQISVPHSELAQVTSLVMVGAFVGNAIGSAIAGGIYTGKLRERLRVRLGSAIGEARLDQLYNSITGTLPAWGTWQRAAVNHAIFRCLMRTVYVTHPGEVNDVQSVFVLVIAVLHRQNDIPFKFPRQRSNPHSCVVLDSL